MLFSLLFSLLSVALPTKTINVTPADNLSGVLSRLDDTQAVEVRLAAGDYSLTSVAKFKNRRHPLILTGTLDAATGRSLTRIDGCSAAVPQKSMTLRNGLIIMPVSVQTDAPFPTLYVGGEPREVQSKTEVACTLANMKRNVATNTYTYTLTGVPSDFKLNAGATYVFIHARWLTIRGLVRSAKKKGNAYQIEMYQHCYTESAWFQEPAAAVVDFYNPDTQQAADIDEGKYVFRKNGSTWQVLYRPTSDELAQFKNGGFIGKFGTLQTLIELSGCSQIKVENICFRNTGVRDLTYGSGSQAECYTQACISIAAGTDVEVKNCDFTGTFGYAVEVAQSVPSEVSDIGSMKLKKDINSTNIRVLDNYVHDVRGGGIMLSSCKNCRVEGNLIKDFGTLMGGSVGVGVRFGNANEITQNTIYNGPYTGISIGWTWGYDDTPTRDNHVAYNHIHHCMQALSDDGGGIYTLGNASGTILEQNLIHDILSRNPKDAAALYFDEGTANILARYNVCWGCDRFVHQHYGRDNVVENNLFAYSNTTAFRLSRAESHRSLSIKNNLVILDSGELFDVADGAKYAYADNQVDESARKSTSTPQCLSNAYYKVGLSHAGTTFRDLSGAATASTRTFGSLKLFGKNGKFKTFAALEHPDRVGVQSASLQALENTSSDLTSFATQRQSVVRKLKSSPVSRFFDAD